MKDVCFVAKFVGCWIRLVEGFPALMLACLAAYHISRAIRPESIYHDALHRGTAIEEDT
jgi:H+/Cl- antiporter ClcA